jgi:hypothetical protein
MRLTKEITKSVQLSRYQREEWKYHRHSVKDLRSFIYETKKLNQLQQMNKKLLKQTIDSTVTLLKTAGQSSSVTHVERIKKLDEQFWHTNEGNHSFSKKYHHHFTNETIVLFVILSIHDVLEELEAKHRRQLKHEVG